jgi:hypothetical protein
MARAAAITLGLLGIADAAYRALVRPHVRRAVYGRWP